MSFYRPQRLSDVWPILYDIPFADNLANQLLQQRAQKRIGADQALRHRYFSDLPPKIFELGDGAFPIDHFFFTLEVKRHSLMQLG